MVAIVRRILNLAGPTYRGKMVWGLVFRILKSLFASFVLMAVLFAFTQMHALTTDVALTAVGMLAASVTGQFVCQYLSDIFLTQSSYRLFHDLRLEIGDKLKRAPMGYFSEQRLGNIQTVLTTTMGDLEANCALGLSFLVGGFSQALFMGAMITVFCPPVGTVVLAILALGAIALTRVQSRAARFTARMQRAQESLTGRSIEYIRGIAVVRSFTGTGSTAEVDRAFDEKYRIDIDCTRGTAVPMKLYSSLFRVGAAVLFGTTALLAVDGIVDMAVCLTLIVASFLVFMEIEQMGDGAFLSKLLAAQLDRLESVFDIPAMDGERRSLQPPFDIELAHVDFSYGETPVLRDVSLTIPAGTTCAIVGPSGSGKTTLANLTARFWDVDAGAVRVGGTDVREIDPEALLAQVSMVFQDVYLFHESIEENIRFGAPEATHEQVVAAARRARCHEFITALPAGYATVVGEGGSTLSGGERQRISLARAMLKDAPLVILDEATSSIDPENELPLIAAIEELTRGKTLVTIAHRLSTVRTADQIVVIDGGRVVQRGTHEELAAQPGVYARFLAAREEAASWTLTRGAAVGAGVGPEIGPGDGPEAAAQLTPKAGPGASPRLAPEVAR